MMKKIALAITCSALLMPLARAAETGFLEGVAQEVIVKVQTEDGVKWYRVKPDGSRSELDLRPGDRIDFRYATEPGSAEAITIKPKQ
jgi:hypothetical protein